MQRNELHADLGYFKACAEEAPEGCYEQAKAVKELIGDTCDSLMRELRGLGLKANAGDRAFDLEAAIYDYIRRSNPEETVFPTAEGFGRGLEGPARERVMAQAASARDFLSGLRAA